MANEEKALEIYNRETDKGFHLGTHSLVEMADWKDHQFKEYLKDKAISAKEKRDADNLYGCDWDKWDDIYSAYMQIINELFKEE